MNSLLVFCWVQNVQGTAALLDQLLVQRQRQEPFKGARSTRASMQLGCAERWRADLRGCLCLIMPTLLVFLPVVSWRSGAQDGAAPRAYPCAALAAGALVLLQHMIHICHPV